MKDKEAHEVIGRRAAELVNHPIIQAGISAMLAEGYTKEDVVKWVYKVAIGTLYGRAKK